MKRTAIMIMALLALGLAAPAVSAGCCSSCGSS